MVTPGDAQDEETMARFSVRKAPAVMAFHAKPPDAETRKGEIQIGLALYDRGSLGFFFLLLPRGVSMFQVSCVHFFIFPRFFNDKK